MKIPALIATLVSLSFSAELAQIPVSTNWTVVNGAAISGDTLILTGGTGKYAKATIDVTLSSAPSTLYFCGKMILENVVPGAKAISVPKFKIYDGAGQSIKAFNIDPSVQGEWYYNGMAIERFSNLGTTSIKLEFGLQDCEGTMKVVLPTVTDTPPSVPYEFPYTVPSAGSSISLTSTAKHPFNNDLLSMNAHFVSSRPLSWSDAGVKAILKDRLPLGNMRFPAGTVGNFYDWETDGFYNDSWALSSAARQNAYNEGFKFDYPGFKDNVTTLGASATIMCNVIEDSPAKATAMMTSRLADGLPVKFVELGNENFFADQSYGNVDTISMYINHTKQVAANLKALKSDLIVAVNTDRHSYLAGDWNDLLSKESYYDACVIHPYTKTGTFLLNKPALRTIFGAFKSTKEVFTQHKAMFETKPLLLTEWNILTDGAPSNFAQALGVADQFLAVAEGGDDSTVIQSGIHTFIHSDVNDEQTLYYGSVGDIKATRLAIVYEKIVNTFKAHDIFNDRIVSSELETGLPAVNGRALDYGDSIKIFAVNKLPVESPLSITFDGSAYSGGYSISSFTEPMIGETSYELTDNPWITTASTGSIMIPASSVAVITFKKPGETQTAVKQFSATKIALNGTTLAFPSAKARTVELYGMNGRKILSKEISTSSMNIGAEPMASGIYSLLVKENGAQVFSTKLIR